MSDRDAEQQTSSIYGNEGERGYPVLLLRQALERRPSAWSTEPDVGEHHRIAAWPTAVKLRILACTRDASQSRIPS
jgi:hypothetical protein